MSKKIAIYARVSTDKQSVENQLIELRAVAERSGYEIVSEYLDEGISGAKSRQDRLLCRHFFSKHSSVKSTNSARMAVTFSAVRQVFLPLRI